MELSSLLPGLCGALGISPQTALTHKNAREVQHYLQGVWDKVLAVYQPQRQAAGEYYRKLLSGIIGSQGFAQLCDRLGYLLG